MVGNSPHQHIPLRGAIIGFGNVAAYAHVPAWQEYGRFTIDAVVEPDPNRALLARELLPDARVYSDVKTLFVNNGLDFIDICTPPCYHVDLTLAAFKSGLHVFCEKPLANSVENMRRISHEAERARRVVFTVNNWKYAPLWVKVLELVGNGGIGSIKAISLNVLRPPNSGGGASDWRRQKNLAWGGILIDHGWHNLYVILSLMRELPVTISAKMESTSSSDPDLEETVDLEMRFRNAVAHLHLTWNASCRRNHGFIEGDKGSICINDDHIMLRSCSCEPVRFDFKEPLSAGSHHPEWMRPVIERFEHQILRANGNGNGKNANLTEAQWCTELIHLAYRSSREGSRPVDVAREVA